MTKEYRDMSPIKDLSRGDFSGPVRKSYPTYIDHLPPCNHSCPAGEDIQGWLALAQAGKFKQAWEHILINNPMPAVHGRVCYHPCETSCNRGDMDGAVSIHAVERFLGDQANQEDWDVPIAINANSKRILVIGAGPAGLSAAYHLRRMGHEVEIREASPVPGGMMQYGIPAYRLPRDILEQDVHRIQKMGVKISCNHRVQDLMYEKTEGKFDAVFLGLGATKPSFLDIPTQPEARVISAVEFLNDVSSGKKPTIGEQVLVYGAGNTAMDAARSAFRMGAKTVTIIFFWDRPHMEAHNFEIVDAESEGTQFKCLSTIASIETKQVTLRKMQLGPDGKPQPTEVFEALPMDTVIMALGQRPDSHFLEKVPNIELNADGTIVVSPYLMTGEKGIFAGGDTIPGNRSVTTAVGLGKKAARYIDGWLRNKTYMPEAKHPITYYQDLHLPIFGDAPQTVQKELPVEDREGFAETLMDFSEEEAVYEAGRCLSCGNCYECDNCLAACPEQALIKMGLGQGYQVDMTRCTGCAVCMETCPCHAIDMVSEKA